MIWASPWAFALFVPFLILAGLVFFKRNKMKSSLLFSSLKNFKNSNKTWRVRLLFLPHLLKWISLSLVILALARPQKTDIKIKKNIEGIDILICLDISDSMLIEDMKPTNRLESSKKIIDEFILGRVSDRIGLIVFSGESYTRVPLTLDYSLLRDNLSQVQTSENIKMGTAIGVALANSVNRMKSSNAKSKVIIFLTDGESNTGTIDPLTALDIAKKHQLKIYSIGVGKDGQAQLPRFQKDPFGKVIKSYYPIHSKINESLLKRFASETGGRFYRALHTPTLKDVFNEIDKLEKVKIDVSHYTKYAEIYPEFLKIAFLLFFIGWGLNFFGLRRWP